jgi:hypothetical protein
LDTAQRLAAILEMRRPAPDGKGHANISTTSRYLGSMPVTRERAMQRFEKHQNRRSQPPEQDSHTTAECDDPNAVILEPVEPSEVMKQ